MDRYSEVLNLKLGDDGDTIYPPCRIGSKAGMGGAGGQAFTTCSECGAVLSSGGAPGREHGLIAVVLDRETVLVAGEPWYTGGWLHQGEVIRD